MEPSESIKAGSSYKMVADKFYVKVQVACGERGGVCAYVLLPVIITLYQHLGAIRHWLSANTHRWPRAVWEGEKPSTRLAFK